jgi:starvation-inducible DNA-binding protein
MKPIIGVPGHEIEEIVTLMNALLVDEYTLYLKTRNAHWHIKGTDFNELHKVFENNYKALDVMIDEIAQRVRSLGHYALGSLEDFLSVTHLVEEGYNYNDTGQIIQILLNQHKSIIHIIRKDISLVSEKYNDLGASDFLALLMKQHKKMSWMLRSYLSKADKKFSKKYEIH